MRAAGLTRHYHLLSAAERLALMLSAVARGDDAEHHRLTAAAPKVSWQVPDTFGHALALREVLDDHRMELLSLACYFQALATSQALDDLSDPSGPSARCLDAGLFLGYLFRARVDGWRVFCDRLGLDTSLLERLMPGEAALDMAADMAGRTAFTAEGRWPTSAGRSPARSRCPRSIRSPTSWRSCTGPASPSGSEPPASRGQTRASAPGTTTRTRCPVLTRIICRAGRHRLRDCPDYQYEEC